MKINFAVCGNAADCRSSALRPFQGGCLILTPYVSAISIGVLIFLAVLLVFDRRRAAGTRYLIGLLIILTAIIANRLLFYLGSEFLVYIPFLVFPGVFCYAPAIYLYCEAALFNRSPGLALRVGFTAVPVIVFCVHTAFHIYFPEIRDAAMIVAHAGIVAPYTRLLFAAAALYSLVFLSLSWRNVRLYDRAYQDNFAAAGRDQLQWFKVLLFFNIFLVVSFCGGLIVITVRDLHMPSTPVEGLVALLMIYVILYYFIRKPEIFTVVKPTAAPAGTRGSGKYQKQNLSEIERKAYLAKIENYLTEEKPFLDDKVTLASLARELGIPAHHFSMVINIERNTNFYHFINAYRVEEAKALLTRADMLDETVLDIGLMAGFQSKAGFNKVFKEITGLTPSEFRERHKAA